MERITVKDKTFELYIPREDIRRTIVKMASEISRDMQGKNPLFLSILNGAFIFTSDLIRELPFPCQVSFLRLSSYSGTSTTRQVRELSPIPEAVRNRHVIITEDIVDTGITLDHLLKKLRLLNPLSLNVASLLYKPDAFEKSFPIRYCGMEIPNRFVVGYGLDYDEQGRNLPHIYQLVEP